jgi:glycine/D-amino acid oxidase-like deaminating enzyme
LFSAFFCVLLWPVQRAATTSFWLDRFPRNRRPAYAPLKTDAQTDVVIVGGGLTGAACAASFAVAGVKVVLLEADAIGAGATAGAPGIVREDFDASFQQAAAAHGLRAARSLWQAMRRASLDFATALRRFNIRADLMAQDLVTFSRTADSGRRLRREYQSRRDAGLDHSWLTPAAMSRASAVSSSGGIRTRGFAIDPFRACAGLAALAAARGAAIHERSGVRRIRARRKHIEVATDRGTVSANAAIVATEAPIADLRALRRHLKPLHGYAVVTEPLPAVVRRDVGSRGAAMQDDAEPPHLLRWLKDDRVLFAGAEQPAVPDRGRDKALLQRTGQLMYELSLQYPAISGLQPEYAWTTVHHATADGLPYIGAHRNFPRHLFALGHARHGAGVAWLAARILLRQYLGEPSRGDEFFGFVRILGDR